MPASSEAIADLDSLGDCLTSLTQRLKAKVTQHGCSLYFDYVGLSIFRRRDVAALAGHVERLIMEGAREAGRGHGSLFLSVHAWALSISRARTRVQLAYTYHGGARDLQLLTSMSASERTDAGPDTGDSLPSTANPAKDFAPDADMCLVRNQVPGEGSMIELSVTLDHPMPDLEPAGMADLATVSAWLIGSFLQEESLLAIRLQRDGWLLRQFMNLGDAVRFQKSQATLEPALVIVSQMSGLTFNALFAARHVWSERCRVIYGVGSDSSHLQAVGSTMAGIEIRKIPFSPADLREIKESAASIEAKRNEQSHSEEGPKPLRRPTALVVDDNLVNRVLAAEMLRLLGYDSDMALNGREAVEYIERYRPDAVLMDLDMPVMNGIEATKRIRRYEQHDQGQHRPLTIIATTARDDEESFKACQAAGMAAFVPKPLMLTRLASALPTQGGRLN